MRAVAMTIGITCMFCGCASVQNDYEQAKQQNNQGAYQKFLVSHPDSGYTADVKQRMEELLWLDVTRSEQQGLVKEAQAYQDYLSKYPNGSHSTEAKCKVIELQEAALKQIHEEAIKRVNSTVAPVEKKRTKEEDLKYFDAIRPSNIPKSYVK